MDRPEAEGELHVGLAGKQNEGGAGPFYALWIGSKVAGIGQNWSFVERPP